MTDRLSGGRGAFVSAGRGAFDSEAAPLDPIPVAELYTNLALTGQMYVQYFPAEPGRCVTDFLTGSAWVTELRWGLEQPTDLNRLANATFRGLTSGATWKPVDSGLAFNCGDPGGNPTHEAWTAGTPDDINFNRFYYPLTMDAQGPGGGSITQLFVISNLTAFPSAPRPMENFEQGFQGALEVVTFDEP